MNDRDEKEIYVCAPGREFVMPFIRRALADYALTEIAGETTDYAVMISTTDVYAVAEGDGFNELAPLAGDSDACRAEAAFIEECRARGLAPTLLRCGHIVGTGMNGLPRRMAESIYRGVFVDIKGNEARQSFIHASDLGQAIGLTLGTGEPFNVTDGCDPTMVGFADALSERISQKRLFAVPPKIFRLFYGKDFYSQMTANRTFSSEKLRSRGFAATPVTEYLKTHVYDDESL